MYMTCLLSSALRCCGLIGWRRSRVFQTQFYSHRNWKKMLFLIKEIGMHVGNFFFVDIEGMLLRISKWSYSALECYFISVMIVTCWSNICSKAVSNRFDYFFLLLISPNNTNAQMWWYNKDIRRKINLSHER